MLIREIFQSTLIKNLTKHPTINFVKIFLIDASLNNCIQQHQLKTILVNVNQGKVLRLSVKQILTNFD